MAKKMKFDFKKVAMNTLVIGGTGAAVQIACDAIAVDPEYKNYAILGAGIILPEVVKSPTMGQVGDALLAVGAYRLAQSYDLGGKLGFEAETITVTAKTSGIDYPNGVIGASGWSPSRTVYANPVKKNSTVE